MKQKILVFLLMFMPYIVSPSFGEEKPWEGSIGTTNLFIGWYGRDSSPVPTASTTFILSRRVFDDFALWGVLNLPLSPNKIVTEDGVLIQELTPPTLMFGTSYELLYHQFDEATAVGLDIGVSIGRALTLDSPLFPVGAYRFKLIHSKTSTIYFGVTTSPYNAEGDLVFGLIHGAGIKF